MATRGRFFEIQGLSELNKALQDLPQAAARSVLLRVLKLQAEPIKELAGQLAPDDPRTRASLRDAMMIRAVPPSKRLSDVEVAIGPSRKRFYGMFLEFGTAQFGPQPFMRPAWDNLSMQTLEGIRAQLESEIEAQRKRLARKAEREAAKMKAA